MATCLIMMNVTIFALPMSSTYITFSGLTAAAFMAFGLLSNSSDPYLNPLWLIGELIIWIVSPFVSMALTYIM